KPEAPDVWLASRGRLVLSREQRRVDLVLTNGTRYSMGKSGEVINYQFPRELTLGLNPDTVFGRPALPRGVTEKTIAELQKDRDEKLAAAFPLSPHPEIIQI